MLHIALLFNLLKTKQTETQKISSNQQRNLPRRIRAAQGTSNERVIVLLICTHAHEHNAIENLRILQVKTVKTNEYFSLNVSTKFFTHLHQRVLEIFIVFLIFTVN